MLRLAVEQGVTFFDTANASGAQGEMPLEDTLGVLVVLRDQGLIRTAS